MQSKCLLVVVAALLLMPVVAQTQTDTVDYNTVFKPLKWRNIGPFRGGRSVAATGMVGNTATYYMGTTGGGLWKTDDMGITWRNISDGFFTTGSVGAVAVSESDPNIVFVGMGEHAVRGVMTHHGDGVYKSTDAGKTWTRMGLELTQHIARVVIHPTNPDIVYVAAQGPLYGPSKERGIYKTVDGGKTWNKVLYVDDKTGCAELSMDMNNPRILYAAMWEHGRMPWKVISGGPGSGLYKSTDGGEHWEKLEEGLPDAMGKMAIAVCRSNSEKVYALIESDFEKEAGGLYVSENAGKSWSQVSGDHRLIQRAWYYIEVFPDPRNENTVYVMSAPAMKSMDGGKTWQEISNTHGDYHNLWINPANSDNMIIADDGGAAITFNGGKTWSSQDNMPTAQFYRINTDNLYPYNIYGGQQDNTSVKITSMEPGRGGITTAGWSASAGGESAFLAFNPDDPRYVVGGSYQGDIELLDTKAKAGTNIMANPVQYLSKDAKDMQYRFNWNAPIIWSKHEPNTFYHGAQLLLRTSDMGKTWTEFSPDLTRNDKSKQGKPGVPYTNEAVGAENYGTLSYVIESPHEKGVFYTGSDDGLVHVTRDNGKTWQNVTPAGLQECLVNAIEVSPHDKATVYIATTRYKFNDHTPALYKSTDYGKSWTRINKGIPDGAFTRVVREDDVRKDLLFAGTETGVYISWNGGKDWSPFRLNLPLTPITDLKVYKGNLIAATSGRSFWILDDLSVLRQYNSKAPAFSILQPSPAPISNHSSELDGSDPGFRGTHPYRGVNPANGIVLYYRLPEGSDTALLTLQITDAEGKLVRSYSSKADSTYKKYDGGPSDNPVLPKAKGLNRFVWDMGHAIMPGVPGVYIEGNYNGHKAIPGTYTITLSMGGKQVSTTAQILPGPLYSIDAATYKEWDQLMRNMEADVTTMHTLVNTLYAKRVLLDQAITGLPAGVQFDGLRKQGQLLSDKLKAWDNDMVQRKSTAYDDVENFPNKFSSDYMFMVGEANSELPVVSKAVLDQLNIYTTQWKQLHERAKSLLEQDIPAYNKALWDAGIGALGKQ